MIRWYRPHASPFAVCSTSYPRSSKTAALANPFGIDDCYVEVQTIGKNPELCSTGSTFQECYSRCNACIDANSADANSTIQAYLDPKFRQYLDYCSGSAPTSASPTTSTTAFPDIPASMLTTVTMRLLMPVTGLDGKIAASRFMPTTITRERDEATSSLTVTSLSVTSGVASASGVASLQPTDESTSAFGLCFGH